MRIQFTLIAALLLAGCTSCCSPIDRLNYLVNESTCSIIENSDAVEGSTYAVRRNAQVVRASTAALRENHRLLEANK